MVLHDGSILTFYEANGANINPHPVAHRFDLSLAAQGTTPMANLEYRITDATQVDGDGKFWVMNYLFPRDASKLKVGDDPIARRWGRGATHATHQSVERLVELQITSGGVRLTDRAPIQLQLASDGVSRNWEGLVRFEDGFLLVTDTHPRTLFGYVQAQ
jgi:hypothetical protein